jgi:hypothetical protein
MIETTLNTSAGNTNYLDGLSPQSSALLPVVSLPPWDSAPTGLSPALSSNFYGGSVTGGGLSDCSLARTSCPLTEQR